MIPVWIQLVTAVSAGLVSALLGVALVPYLQKLRFFPSDAGEENAEEARKPISGGILLFAGLLSALVLGGTLYLQCSGADRTDAAFSEQLRKLTGVCVYSGLLFGCGFLTDYLTVRSRYYPKSGEKILLTAVFLTAAVCALLWGISGEERAASPWMLLLPVPAVLCFVWECGIERNTDGAIVSVNAVELLVLTVLLLRQSLALSALLTLAGAGGCLGCMVWCLHPAKCRIGRSGLYLLGGMLPMLCLEYGMYRELALFMAVFALQQIYRLRKRENKYLTEGMADAEIAPLSRIAILAGISAFCGVMALLLKA